MMDRHSRRGTTKAFLRDGRDPGASTVLVCVGDSITEGVGSADWVAMLGEQVGAHGVQAVNAGVAGDLAWNVLRRLDTVIQCDPDIVTLMVGTNDVALEPVSFLSHLTLRMKGVRQPPNLEWFSENVSMILRRLRSETHARLAVIEIPMLGEDLDSKTNERVNTYNEALRSIAAEQAVMCLPLHDRLVELLPPGHVPPPYEVKVGLTVRAQFQHHVLRHSWDEVSASNNLTLLSDHTHLSERAARVVADLVADFVTSS
jgi:lysophospholipase L1-like esterase